MPYDPEVNDYVVWNTPMGLVHKGWVYFKCEDYITIEIGVKPKPHCEYAKNDKHCMVHCLLCCFTSDWKDLTYVTKRASQDDPMPVPVVSTKPAKDGEHVQYYKSQRNQTVHA